MKTSQLLPLLLGGALSMQVASAGSTIATTAQNAYGANIGWTDWKWDPATPEGVTVGTYVVEGKVYGANVGWIDLGDGAPDDGVYYALTSGDWGVNHDGAGGLMGYAYGANIGWITFSQSWASPPRVDLATGAMSGYAYGANVGWISLEGLETSIECGPDSDGDGIEDAWEYEQLAAAGKAADLTLLGPGDADNDGSSDVNEFLADTAPFDNAERFTLEVVSVDKGAGDVELGWNASARRTYDSYSRSSLAPGAWTGLGTGILGGSYTHSAGSLPGKTFYRVHARIPLKP